MRGVRGIAFGDRTVRIQRTVFLHGLDAGGPSAPRRSRDAAHRPWLMCSGHGELAGGGGKASRKSVARVSRVCGAKKEGGAFLVSGAAPEDPRTPTPHNSRCRCRRTRGRFRLISVPRGRVPAHRQPVERSEHLFHPGMQWRFHRARSGFSRSGRRAVLSRATRSPSLEAAVAGLGQNTDAVSLTSAPAQALRKRASTAAAAFARPAWSSAAPSEWRTG